MRLVSSIPLILTLALAPACDRLTPPPAHEQAKAAPNRAEAAPAGAEALATSGAPPAPATADPAALNPNARKPIVPGGLPEDGFRFPAPERLVALGDVHGDIAATRRALRLAGAIDADDHWIGGELVVVQTGDQLDRGDDEQAILELFAKVQREAAAAGGAVHVLNGNHEFMNALGDLRYVTPGGYADFADAPGVDIGRPELGAAMAETREQARARVAAF